MSHRSHLAPVQTLVLSFVVVLAIHAPAAGRTISVIGTGEMGSALGHRWAEAGHEIVFGSRSPESERVRALVASVGGGARALDPAAAAAAGEVVVLAIPFHAVERLLPTLGDLHRKVVIDCTNPLTLGMDGLVVGTTGSAAETVAALLPGARVVKAFNTTGAGIILDPTFPDGPLTMPLAGESDLAKALVARLVEDLGFEPVDAGPLRSARWLEPMAMLWIELARHADPGTDVGFRLIRRAPTATSDEVAP